MSEFAKTEIEIELVKWLAEQNQLDYAVQFDPCQEPSYDDYDERSYILRLHEGDRPSLRIMFTAEGYVGFGILDSRPEKLQFIFGFEPAGYYLKVITLLTAAVFGGQSRVVISRLTGSRHFEVPLKVYQELMAYDDVHGVRTVRANSPWAKIIELPYN